MKNIILLISLIWLTASSAMGQEVQNSVYDNAKRNYISGNFEEAIKYYNEYIRSYSNNDKAIYERGMCFESLRRYDEALKDYTNAINIKPFYDKYYESRGYVYLKINLPQNALDDFTRAIRNNAFSAEGYWGRTNAYLDLDKYGPALTDINSAINIDPSNYMYYYVRAVLYMTNNDTVNFYNDLDLIIDKYSSSFFSGYKSQYVILILDNISTNTERLTRLLTEKPEDNFTYFRRGFNYYLLKKFNLAIEDFTNAVRFTSEPDSRLITLSTKLVNNCKIYSIEN